MKDFWLANVFSSIFLTALKVTSIVLNLSFSIVPSSFGVQNKFNYSNQILLHDAIGIIIKYVLGG